MEQQFYQWLTEHVPSSDKLPLGIGDDAAVLGSLGESNLVCTTDLLTDSVDFLIEKVTPVAIGHKALGVNLSDLAAMAAKPMACLISLLLPKEGSSNHSAYELAVGLYEGILPLAAKFDTVIAGGDTNTWAGPLAISITAFGRTTPSGPLQRSGAQPGDVLLVTGPVGGSILGRHLAVEPRIAEALFLHEHYHLTAGIDISDGLALDASRLATASEVGIEINVPSIPIAAAAHELARQSGQAPLQHALADGEDFELLLTLPSSYAEQLLQDQSQKDWPLEVHLTQIGTVVTETGLWQRDGAGNRSVLVPQGFVHEGD